MTDNVLAAQAADSNIFDVLQYLDGLLETADLVGGQVTGGLAAAEDGQFLNRIATPPPLFSEARCSSCRAGSGNEMGWLGETG